jgi:spermidine synthase
VVEVDPGVVEMDREQLGLTETDGLQVEVADARVGLDQEAAGERDLVVGDAFGGLSVPWQLTTVEALGLVDRALTDDGRYVANLIDNPPLGFVRAELATLQAVFPHVALLARDGVLAGEGGGNVVVLASQQPLPLDAVGSALGERDLDWRVASGAELAEFVGNAEVLTDDHAPVDQLLTPYAAPE